MYSTNTGQANIFNLNHLHICKHVAGRVPLINISCSGNFSYSDCIMAVSFHMSSTCPMQRGWRWSFFFFFFFLHLSYITLSKGHTDIPKSSYFKFYIWVSGLHENVVKTTEQSGAMQECKSCQAHLNIQNSLLNSRLPPPRVFPLRVNMRLSLCTAAECVSFFVSVTPFHVL